MSWSSNNEAGAFASPLKLPLAGYRFGSNGKVSLVGTDGNYWSSTVSGVGARFLFILSLNANMSATGRADGISVRCIKD